MNSLKGILICLLVHVGTQTSGKTETRVFKKGNITLGALLSIHDSGEDQTCGKLHSFGLGFAETLMYTVDVINNSSDILPGVTLGYDIRDYCESPTLSMKWTYKFVKNNYMNDLDLGACGNASRYTSHYQEMISGRPSSLSEPQALESPIVAVVGAQDSGTTVLVAQLLQVVNVPLISPFSSSEQLSSSYYSAFFRTIPPDGLQAKAMADVIELFNWSYVAVVAVDHSYGRYGVQALENEAERRKTFCAGVIEYFPRTGYETKMDNIIEKLSKQKLRVVILWANSHQSVAFLKKAMDSNLDDKIWILSDDYATSSSKYFFKGFPSQVKGVFLGIAHHFHDDSSLNKHFQSLPLLGKRNIWWDEFIQEEFNCSLSAPRNGLPSCSKKNLSLSSSTLNKLFNPFTPYVVDAVMAVAHALDSMYKCNDSIGQCPETRPFIKSEDLVEYIRNITMDGITGKVWFDEHGNPKSSAYDIVNIYNQSGGLFVTTKIGTWNIGEGLRINSSSINWSVTGEKAPSSVCAERCSPGAWRTRMKNCCWECIPCHNGSVSEEYDAQNCTKCTGVFIPNGMKTACIEETVVNVMILSSIGMIFTTIAGAGILLSFVSLLLFIKFYETPLVKASNRELSFTLLAIIVFGFALAIVHVVLPTDSICKLIKPWRYSIHCLSVSILFIKTIRMARAFQLEMAGLPKCCKRFVVNSKLQVITLIILNTCPVLLAILWRFLDAPFVTKEYKELPHETQVEFLCEPYQGDTGYGLKLASLCYLILLTLTCIFYSFKARNLPGNFNETRYIGLSLYILLLSWLAYFPINSALKGWYVAIISSATASLASYGLLGCIFGPKLFIILFHPEMNTNEFVRAELRIANRGPNSVSAQSN